MIRIRTTGTSIGQFGLAAKVRAVRLLAAVEGGEPEQVSEILQLFLFILNISLKGRIFSRKREP